MFKIILPSIKFKVERWKYNEEYQIYVSSLGRFKDEHKKDIKMLIGSNGYCMVNTWKGLKAAHRLVLMTYKPLKSMDNLTVDHLNHNKRNNELSNLEWTTFETNQTRAKEDFIQLEQSINEKKEQRIRSGCRHFDGIDDAVDFVIEKYVGNSKGNKPDKYKIKKKIRTAISTKTLYCNREWSFM